MSFLEDRLLYFPLRRLDAFPADYGLRSEELSPIASDGVRLHGWWVHGRGDRVLLLFLVDYRGYGRSAGHPSEAGLYRDGLAIYDAAVERGFPAERIVLFGESLGCAVAVEVALALQGDRGTVRSPSGGPSGVALETPFLSVLAVACEHYPFVPRFLVRSRYDTASKIARVVPPKLFVAAALDEIAPVAHARRLFELAKPPKELLVVPGAGHNETSLAGGEEYLSVWRRFLDAIDSV